MKNETRFEYEFYIPTADNNGNAYPAATLLGFRAELNERFGGLTDTKQRNEGLWKVGGTTVRDEILIWKVIAPPTDASDQFVAQMQEKIRSTLRQETILIVRREIVILVN